MLLLDAGNSRIKWALVESSQWLVSGAFPTQEVQRLATALASEPRPSRAVCVSVAGRQVEHVITATLAQMGLTAEWFRSTGYCCGVRNDYDQPGQLGADRWAALVAAHALHGAACLVVSAGTATTIDRLDADGGFRGGVILPGEQLMREALAGNTAQLPLAKGTYQPCPRNTMDAIVSGCRQAQAGAIERMFRAIAHQPRALCLLTGGNAAALAPLLSSPQRRVDNLVLHGLALAATTHASPSSKHADNPFVTGDPGV